MPAVQVAADPLVTLSLMVWNCSPAALATLHLYSPSSSLAALPISRVPLSNFTTLPPSTSPTEDPCFDHVTSGTGLPLAVQGSSTRANSDTVTMVGRLVTEKVGGAEGRTQLGKYNNAKYSYVHARDHTGLYISTTWELVISHHLSCPNDAYRSYSGFMNALYIITPSCKDKVTAAQETCSN